MRNGKEILLVIAAALVVALGALVLSPVLAKNIIFLAALPVVAVVFLVLVLNIQTTFLFVLCTRSMMDPVLQHTKGEGRFGVGALLNLFIILIGMLLVMRFPKVLAKNRYVTPWIVFLGIGTLSVFYTDKPMPAVRLLLNLITYLCMFVAPFFIIKTEADKKFWIKVLLFSSFLPVAFANLGLVWSTPLLVFAGRVQGTFTHPNILAFYITLVVTVAFYVLRAGVLNLSLPGRIMLWCYIADLLVILIRTQTRGAWIACAIFFLVYGFLREKKVLFFCLLAGLLLTAVPQVQERFRDLMSGTGAKKTEQLNSAAWRVKLWESSVPMIKDRLLTGYGLESFRRLSREFSTLANWEGAPAHNVYVELIFEVGLFGLLSYLWIFGSILKTFYARIRTAARVVSIESAMMVAYITGYLFVGGSDNMLHYLAFNWYFWFFLGVMLCGGMLAKPAVTASSEGPS